MWKIITKKTKNKKSSEQHAGFPGGHPSKYSPRPTPFHFGDRTRTGAFGVVWPLTKYNGVVRLL